MSETKTTDVPNPPVARLGEDINTTLVVVIGVVGTLVFVMLLLVLQLLYASYQDRQFEQKVIQAPASDMESLVTEQNARLQQTGWLDREQQRVAIPIERAMQLTVEELQPSSTKSAARE